MAVPARPPCLPRVCCPWDRTPAVPCTDLVTEVMSLAAPVGRGFGAHVPSCSSVTTLSLARLSRSPEQSTGDGDSLLLVARSETPAVLRVVCSLENGVTGELGGATRFSRCRPAAWGTPGGHGGHCRRAAPPGVSPIPGSRRNEGASSRAPRVSSEGLLALMAGTCPSGDIVSHRHGLRVPRPEGRRSDTCAQDGPSADSPGKESLDLSQAHTELPRTFLLPPPLPV